MTYELSDEWERIHDFCDGFGYRRQEKIMFVRDVERLMKINLFAPDNDLDTIYEQLQPLLLAEFEKIRREFKPIHFNKIILPRINRPYPILHL